MLAIHDGSASTRWSILDSAQPLSAADVTDDAVTLRWDGPLRNPEGEFDVHVQVHIALGDEGVQFQTTVRNRTPHVLAEVWHAGLGGLMGIGTHAGTRISAYVAEVLRIRDDLKETIFLGEFLDMLGVSVSPHPSLKYNTHRNPRTGKRACVLVNQRMESLETCVVFEGGGEQQLCVYRPFEPVARGASPLSVEVRAERLVIVAED